MNSCLITGAAGFVGYHLAMQISQNKDCLLYLSDNFVRGENDDDFKALLAAPNVKFLPGDLRDNQYISSLPNVEYIFHFAAFNGTQNFYKMPFDVFDNSSSGTINLIRYYAKNKPIKFVYAGTSESYADAVTHELVEIPTPEVTTVYFEDITNPRWSYAFAKTAGEVAIHSASAQFKLNHLILRLHNLYGPRMGYDHVIPDLFRKQIRNSGEVLGLNQTRSFMFVTDAVRLIIQLAIDSKVNNETYNLGSNQEITIRDLVREICNLTKFAGKILDLGAPPGSVDRRVPDITKLEKSVDCMYTTSLQDGLMETFLYIKKTLEVH
jgi:nucleoside-diphosphate-sugar epimerase